MASSNIIILKARYTSIYILYLTYTKKFVNDLMLKKSSVALFRKAKKLKIREMEKVRDYKGGVIHCCQSRNTGGKVGQS